MVPSTSAPFTPKVTTEKNPTTSEPPTTKAARKMVSATSPLSSSRETTRLLSTTTPSTSRVTTDKDSATSTPSSSRATTEGHSTTATTSTSRETTNNVFTETIPSTTKDATRNHSTTSTRSTLSGTGMVPSTSAPFTPKVTTEKNPTTSEPPTTKAARKMVSATSPPSTLKVTTEKKPATSAQCKEAALGMENMKISDSQITASTEYCEKYSTRKARLNGPGSWRAKQNDSDPWIEVDLSRNETITEIATQGSRWGSGLGSGTYGHCKSWEVAFGLQNGKIRNSQLRSSSVYQNKTIYSEKNGRMKGKNSWSRVQTNDNKQWIQVDLGGEEIATGIASQGDGNSSNWVKSYFVSYSLDGIIYKNYTNDGDNKVFNGNEDQMSVVTNVLSPAITARYIRIHPVSWFHNISLRIEVIGCYTGSCNRSEVPLGVSDKKMTSSTEKSRFSASDGRLYWGNGWRPTENNQSQWLQVDLGQKELVTAIATKGSGTGYWVKTYSISYGVDKVNLTSYKINATQKVFDGNTNGNSVVTNVLSPAVTARYIRIHPKTWNNGISLKVELYGCPRVNTIPCKAGEKTLGVEENKKVKDSQLTSSSNWKTSHSAAYGRLYNYSGGVRAGWRAGWRAGVNDKNQWIQVDLGKKEVVSGISTQAGGYYQNSYHDFWVETYFVKHSLNGTTFESYKDGGVDKIFDGNYDWGIIVKNVLSPPITARYIRIHPVSWHVNICMRIELYGCY
ncbi:putative GPI-anchored protein pfl2 [Dendronephthya gigantea]|uniref:putative GPI-anchored protein pfl2 n=1 Tax=Dendronephthya gigantea TaxID=151771 RepID=UPI00106BD1D6|nr:putative GPI-anchored protein pfl2 [Dendronephthya gigantea]